MLKQYSKHIAGSIAITGVLALTFLLRKPTNPYQQRYLQVRAEIANKVDWAKQLISEELHLTADEQNIILHSTISQLQLLMFNKQYTVLQILLTYINRTIQIAFAKHYVCDVCFEEAVQQAKHCDQLIAEDPNNVNRQPLFGIPITIKDTFIAPGTYQTFCVASRTKKRHTEHGIQSYLLEKAGGIVFAKGNLPQFGFSFESDNYLFGRSQHPTHDGRSSGGSSGGDAGLLATDCTAVALGSDSGGSIRIPAHFCGLYGYKPSMKRLCMRGQAKGVGAWDGIRNIGSCYGPMGRHFDDLIPVMEALTTNLESAPVAIKDINFYMAPFQKQLCYSTNKLRIGVLRSIDMMLPSTACQRALQLAVDKLAAAGHEIVEMAIDQKLLERAYQIAFHVFLGDGGMRATEELYEGEPMIHHFDVFRSATQSKLRRFKQWLLRLQDRKRELIIWEAGDHGLSYYEMSNLTAELAGLQMQMHNIWEQYKIDGMVSPVTASAAVKHDTAMKCFTSICYTFVWNMLDYSAGAVPITTVQADEQSYHEESKYGCKDIEYHTVQHIMEGSVGLPVGVQVISRPLQDEMCLNIMRQCV